MVTHFQLQSPKKGKEKDFKLSEFFSLIKSFVFEGGSGGGTLLEFQRLRSVCPIIIYLPCLDLQGTIIIPALLPKATMLLSLTYFI